MKVPESICLDIVDLDDGYAAYYVDGKYDDETCQHMIDEVIRRVEGKFVSRITYHFADKYANGERELPEKYEDIEW